MTLNGVIAVILRYFSEFRYLPGAVRRSSRSYLIPDEFLSAQWNQLHGPVRSIIYFCRFQSEFFRTTRALLVLKNSITISNFCTVEHPLLLMKLCAELFSLVFRMIFGLFAENTEIIQVIFISSCGLIVELCGNAKWMSRNV